MPELPNFFAFIISFSLFRDVRGIHNDVKRLLDACQKNCPGECDSCGAEKIDEVTDKLKDYRDSLADLEEEEAKDSIRTDLMAFM